MSDLVLNRGITKGKCRSCKADVVFAYTLAGKLAPWEPDPDGFYVIENGAARHVGPRPAQLEIGAGPAPDRYVSHFARCPDAPLWRGKK